VTEGSAEEGGEGFLYCPGTGGDIDASDGSDVDEMDETEIGSRPPAASICSHSSGVQSPNVILSLTVLYRCRRFSQSRATARSMAAAEASLDSSCNEAAIAALDSSRSILLPLDAAPLAAAHQEYPFLRS
jgi:hypothetical protein